ncbi:hypothetical protein BDB00DRAFT_830727 [Zychaea mexicana]|uniref:uncharacterized protein n=1 Tax=Zychaea mexicana TaxID=64656 RepID=UPI0022FE2887|nr:uncharacterized protein BDB00DRAFT_830727 [Zychaea mexicana]KAI9492010.1 hypothetical protein BDB00DRAFT_830727 [Zychaea mexicana]
MDVQGYLPPPPTAATTAATHRPEDAKVLHYAQVNLTQANNSKPPSLPPMATVPSRGASVNEPDCNGSVTSEGRSSSPSPPYASSWPPLKHHHQDAELSAIPAFVFDKRKSSPAVLGLPLGLNDEAQAQLSLHLSQQRNSIEAAMLLANFNRLPSTPAADPTDATASTDDDDKDPSAADDNSSEHKPASWQEDSFSVASDNSLSHNNNNNNRNRNRNNRPRRHSYDASMTWASLPSDRSTFLQDLSGSSSSSSSASSMVHPQQLPYHLHPHQQQHHPPPHHHHPFHPHLHHHPHLHPTAKLTFVQDMSPAMLHPPPSSAAAAAVGAYPVHDSANMIHPLSASSDQKQQHDFGDQTTTTTSSSSSSSSTMPHPPPPPQHPHYYPYHPHPYMHHPAAVPPPHPHATSSGPPPGTAAAAVVGPPPGHPHAHYYYQHVGKLPLPIPIDGMMHAPLPGQFPPMPTGAVRSPNRRKKNRMEVDEDDMSTAVEPGDPDFPDMSLKDIEAARVDPEARPRRQKLRYVGDKYTPQWVRYNGQAKEGLCDTCQPGKWLQLKNSAFWYHKQFFHGISSVSGKEFMQPLETRWVDQDLVEGLCHQCRQWVSVSNVKRKNSVLWYRHAHKCHVYHKPKPNAPKRR